MTREQILALREICTAIIETVRAAGPLGAPAGPMYAALMTQGCTLQQFDGIMGGLVRAGLIRESGHCYHLAEVK